MKNTTLLLLFLLGLLSHAQTPVQLNGQLKVCGLNLCNEHDQPIQLRGMSTHGTQWFGWGSCITSNSMSVLANDFGSDLIRISTYVQEGGYETDPSGFVAQVNTIVEEATSLGMYVLIDWHQLSPGDPNANTASAKNFFTSVATAHKDKNNIIYDIANEPNNVSWALIKSYAEEMIPFVRAIDDDAVILCGTHGWASLGISDGGSAQDIVSNPINATNFMYAFHFYAKDHQQIYYNELDWASDRLPIFVTEWGTQEATGDGPNDFVMSQQYIDLLAAKKISWANWNYSDDFRTGAIWNTGTCNSGQFTVANLKPAGVWIRDRLLFPADDFGTIPSCPSAVEILGDSIYCGTPITLSSSIIKDDSTTFEWFKGGVSMAPPSTQTVDIQVIEPNTYTLKINRNLCSEVSDNQNIVSDLLPISPIDPTACTGQTINLEVPGGDNGIKWSDAAVNGTILSTGPMFTTPILNQTTTFYAIPSTTPSTNHVVGFSSRQNTTPSPTTGWHNKPSEFLYETVFDVRNDIILNSVKVYGDITQTLGILIKNSGGTTIFSKTVTISSGENTITLDANIPAGIDYKISATGTTEALWQDVFTSSPYPITEASNTVTIKNLIAPWGIQNTWFGHFYNWKFQQGDGLFCNATPVTITVDICTALNNLSNTTISIYPNPSDQLITISGVNESNEITVYSSVGKLILVTELTNNQLDISGLVQGLYLIDVNGNLKPFIVK